MVPDPVRRWVADRLGTGELSVEAFPAGLTGSVFRVTTSTGYACVLRTLPLSTWGAEAARQIESERIGLTALSAGPLPVPAVIASDPEGSAAGAPSSLTTLLPGELRLDPPGPVAVTSLARAAVVVHRSPVRQDRPHDFELWGRPTITVPEWSEDATLWRAVIAQLEAGPPATPYVLLHRDFHPGNVLWQDERISGVIDWAETAMGPADLDVAHCATNLAMLAGPDTALDLRTAYRSAGGELTDDPYWQLADVAGFLPDPVDHLQGYRRVRTDLAGEVIRERFEALVGAVMSR